MIKNLYSKHYNCPLLNYDEYGLFANGDNKGMAHFMKQTAISWAHSAVVDIPMGMAAFTANTTHIATAPLYFLKDFGNMSHFMRDWRSLQDSNAAWHQLWNSQIGKYLPGDYESMAYNNGRQVAGYLNAALLMAKALNITRVADQL